MILFFILISSTKMNTIDFLSSINIINIIYPSMPKNLKKNKIYPEPPSISSTLIHINT